MVINQGDLYWVDLGEPIKTTFGTILKNLPFPAKLQRGNQRGHREVHASGAATVAPGYRYESYMKILKDLPS